MSFREEGKGGVEKRSRARSAGFVGRLPNGFRRRCVLQCSSQQVPSLNASPRAFRRGVHARTGGGTTSFAASPVPPSADAGDGARATEEPPGSGAGAPHHRNGLAIAADERRERWELDPTLVAMLAPLAAGGGGKCSLAGAVAHAPEPRLVASAQAAGPALGLRALGSWPRACALPAGMQREIASVLFCGGKAGREERPTRSAHPRPPRERVVHLHKPTSHIRQIGDRRPATGRSRHERTRHQQNNEVATTMEKEPTSLRPNDPLTHGPHSLEIGQRSAKDDQKCSKSWSRQPWESIGMGLN